MIAGTMATLADAVGGELHGVAAPYAGVCTDTRRPVAGSAFFALRGPNHDAHAFVMDAFAGGVAGVVVERRVDAGGPEVVVTDTRAALAALARSHRDAFAGPVVGITGSNGKTTVKEMTASILRVRGPVLATRGNLNNDVGVPLTLLDRGVDDWALVVEMGANHPGEIAYLASVARPTVAVVTNAGPAHLEGFGSVAGVARAKGELFEALGPDGVAVINVDDAYASVWRDLAGARTTLGFGLGAEADFSARDARPDDGGQRFTLVSPDGERDVRLPVPGPHNLVNALAAAALASAAGATLDETASGLARFTPAGGRLRALAAANGARVIDDTYNANPASLRAALAVLASSPGRRWLVLGDMGELGPDAEALHRQAGLDARAAGVERMFALGPLAAVAASTFGSDDRFTDAATLARVVRDALDERVTVLVKGSRSMRLERVVAALTAEEG